METAVGNATDQLLTEGANAPGIREGNVYPCCHCDRVATDDEKLGVRDTCPNWLGQCYHNYYIETYQRANRRVYVATTEGWDDVDRWVRARDIAWERLAVSQVSHNAYAEQRTRELAHQRNREKLHKGAWAFTLTYSPVKHGWSKDEAQAAMSEAIRRLQHYYRNELVEFDAVGEYTQAGLPHVHGHYRLNEGRRMTTKNFKRAYPIWNPNVRIGKGHEGGYHEPAVRDSDYSGYIRKDLDESWLVVTTTRDVDNAQEANLPEAPDHEAQASVSSSRSEGDAEPSHR